MKNFCLWALVALSLTGIERAEAFGKKPADIEIAKPTGDESPAEAAKLCEGIFRQNKAHTLVIAFEGLASFDSSGTKAAYVYHWKLSQGQAATAPRAGRSGYLLHGLIVPMIAQASFEFLVFPHGSISEGRASPAQSCAEIWLQQPGRSLVITGHSYGGHAAQNLADNLDQARITVDAVITVDPRLRVYAGDFGKTRNVRLWENFYQTNTPFLNGYVVPGADSNQDLSRSGVSHTGMTKRPEVAGALRRVLGELR